MPVAARVYAEQLLPRGHGLPLWEPEPGELGEVDVGDVGFIDEGSFCRLFNATRAGDDPVNVFGVPDGFVVLEYNEKALRHTSTNYVPPGPIYSSSMRHFSIGGGPSIQGISGSYKFSCHSNQGALVVLGDHGTRSIVRKNTVFEQYMRAHRDSWLEFARALGHNVDPDDIILVSGWTKTSQWALAACTNYGRAHEVSLDASVGVIAGAKFEIKLCQDVEMSVDQRSGPSRPIKDVEEQPSRDQCLFLRYYKMKRNTFGVKKIVAGSGPRRCSSHDGDERRSHPCVPSDEHRLRGAPRQGSYDSALGALNFPYGDDNDNEEVEDDISEEPCTLPQNDPLDVLLDYILTNSSAMMAIVCHEDLYTICSGDWPLDLESFLNHIRPLIHVDEHHVGTIRHHGETAHALPRISESIYSEKALETGDTDMSEDQIRESTVCTNPVSGPSNNVSVVTAENGQARVVHSNDKLPSSKRQTQAPIQAQKAQLAGVLEDSPNNSITAGVERTSPPNDARTPLDMKKLLHQFRQAHHCENPRARRPCRRKTHHPFHPWRIDTSAFPLSAHAQPPQEKAPGPDKYSSKVLCAAPLGYIFFYRACTRFTARPHLAAAHMSASVAVGAIVYRKRRAAGTVYDSLEWGGRAARQQCVR